LRKTLK
jgi:hypothetical protein